MAQESDSKGKLPLPVLIAVGIAALAVLVVFGRFCSAAMTINVTVNGAPLTLHGAKNMETAIRESGLPVNPGDLISLTGTTLKKSAGHPFSATVNGEATVDPGYQLHEGDVVVVSDGDDEVESYDAIDSPLAHGGTVTGLGAICAITPGVDGVCEERTGRISGDVVQKTKEAATDTTAVRYNPDVGDDKVIALTFDEGPSETFTAEILDILRDNEAKATFFCMGAKVENSPGIVRRECDEGHQVSSGTFSLSWIAILTGSDGGRGVDAQRVAEELEHGQRAISDALDGGPVSRCARIPVSDLTGDIVAAVEGLIDADISWNVDTADWLEQGSQGVYSVLKDVEPGDVVLLHDGGGDRSSTVQALRRALPELKRAGYSFITVDDLIDRYAAPDA